MAAYLKLAAIILPASVKEVGKYAFSETGIKSIYFAENTQLITLSDAVCDNYSNYILNTLKTI